MGVPGKKNKPDPVTRKVVVICAAHRQDHPLVVESAIAQAHSDAETDNLQVDWDTFQLTGLVKEGTVKTATRTLTLGSALWAAEYTYQIVPKGK
jgi:hypothetical protein